MRATKIMMRMTISYVLVVLQLPTSGSNFATQQVTVKPNTAALITSYALSLSKGAVSWYHEKYKSWSSSMVKLKLGV